MFRPIALATAVCGTLDILYAMILTAMADRPIGEMLRFVASGPFPQAPSMGAAGAILGLVVHFVLMAIMVTVFVLAVRARPGLLDKPLLSGLAYGLLTYAVMNLVVLPVRFDSPLPLAPMQIARQLFAHIALVGLPIAFITRSYLRG